MYGKVVHLIFTNMAAPTNVLDFYREMFGANCGELSCLFDDKNKQDIGHFNIFSIGSMYEGCKTKPVMPYNRRTYYKISLIHGRNRVEYANKVLDIEEYAVLFATPRIPYRYTPLDNNQLGYFCVFTEDFMSKTQTGVALTGLPIFSPQSDFIFQINREQFSELARIFRKMQVEMNGDYAFKYDLIRNYILELIHEGQKLKPIAPTNHAPNAAQRISTLFVELLERQFPIENTSQVVQLKSAKDFADTLGVHANHLNKVLKETAGRTTSEIIAARLNQEAKILLKQTNWNVSEIAYSLGFNELAHFSHFFKKMNRSSPLQFR